MVKDIITKLQSCNCSYDDFDRLKEAFVCEGLTALDLLRGIKNVHR